MPFTGDTFTHLFDWEKDPQRQEKIINSRLEAEFDGIDAGLTALRARTRERLTGSRSYFVRTDGSDSNDGLANTAGGAFLTIQKAIDTVSGTLDLNTFTATINVAAGTYTGTVRLKPLVGRGSAVIIGDTTTPSNCVISTTGANAIAMSTPCGGWDLRGFKTQTTTAGYHITTDGGEALLFVRQWEFGACPAGWYHVFADNASRIWLLNSYTISGAADVHLAAANNATIQNSGVTVTISGSPAWGIGFALAARGGVLLLSFNTYSGASTGTRYSVSLNAVIDTFGAGATYLPGNAAGLAATGGQYA